MDKKPFLERVVAAAGGRGHAVALFNIGDLMYAEAPDVPKGRILDIPLSRVLIDAGDRLARTEKVADQKLATVGTANIDASTKVVIPHVATMAVA